MTRADGLALGYAAVTGAWIAASGPSALTLGIPTAAFVGLLADGVARPASRVLLPVVSHGPRDGDAVALTFDDGPHPDFTPAIAAALGDARATFFAIGRHLEAHREVAASLHAAGHEVANHSHGHPRLLNLRGPRALRAEIERGAAAVTAITGETSTLYRPPVGLKNPPLAAVAAALGLTVVNWSLHARDTRGATATQIADRVLTRIRPGDIVCLHDGSDRPGANRQATVDAVPRILDGLRARKLRAVTLRELLS